MPVTAVPRYENLVPVKEIHDKKLQLITHLWNFLRDSLKQAQSVQLSLMKKAALETA